MPDTSNIDLECPETLLLNTDETITTIPTLGPNRIMDSESPRPQRSTTNCRPSSPEKTKTARGKNKIKKRKTIRKVKKLKKRKTIRKVKKLKKRRTRSN